MLISGHCAIPKMGDNQYDLIARRLKLSRPIYAFSTLMYDVIEGRIDVRSILFLIPNLGGGGAERALVNLVNNIDYQKYDVTVQTLFDVGVNRKRLNDEVKYAPGFGRNFSGNVFLLKMFTPRFLYNLIVGRKYDIVVSFLEGPAARIISGCPFAESKKASWIHVEQRGDSRQLKKCPAFYSFRNEKEAIKCYRAFDKTICVAETVKEDFLSIFPMIDHVETLYNVIETDEILNKSKEPVEEFDNGISVISVGRLVFAKGYDRLIRVHKRLIRDGYAHSVYILGEGNERKRLENLIKEQGVENTFHLLGFKTNPYPYVAQADAFVCSSRREGFSTAVAEALVLGIPVVSADCSGARELLGRNDEYGIVAENSEDGIYEGLKRMLSGDTIRERRSLAKKRGLQFSKDAAVRAIEKMLDSL